LAAPLPSAQSLFARSDHDEPLFRLCFFMSRELGDPIPLTDIGQFVAPNECRRLEVLPGRHCREEDG